MARNERRRKTKHLGSIRFFGSVVGADTFREDVIAGLSLPEKTLSPKYFYDAAGSLVGMEQRGKGGIFCAAYDPSFVKNDECTPLDAACR